MNKYNITASSELMQNYLQADIMDPTKAKLFVALQTVPGGSLLFSVGTDKVFYVTKEASGSSHGWRRSALSADGAACTYLPPPNVCKGQPPASI